MPWARARRCAAAAACGVVGFLATTLTAPGDAERLDQARPFRAGRFEAEASPPAGLSHGNAGFVLTPTRIVFEGRRRAASVTVVNTGSAPATYRATLVRMRMNSSGEIQPVEAPRPGEHFADTLVRFSPRQFAVKPRGSQTIRLQLRPSAELPEGEYRSHLLVQEIPQHAGNAIPQADRDPSAVGLQVELRPVYGTAIPIIVRHGSTSAEVSLEDFRFRAARSEAQPRTVSWKIVRQGNRSVYGDIEWRYVRDGAKPQLVGRMRGVAVYTPNRERLVQIPLAEAPRRAWKDARLLVSFTEGGPHAPAVAETSLILP